MAHFLSKKYKTKISDTDYDIISLGRKNTLGEKEETEFGKSSRDYIEMNIFNTNGTLLDSIRLNETNKYIDESGEVQSEYHKVPKYIQSKVDKWKHLDFYKKQYILWKH